MKKIHTKNGNSFLVDNCDFQKATEHKWHINKQGYVSRGVKINGKRSTILLHRLLMGAQPGQKIDHINGNPKDNRRSNLRFCTQKQNLQNKKIHKNNKTGYPGVQFHGKRYRAMKMINGKNKHLGIFDTPEEAFNEYRNISIKLDPTYSVFKSR